MSNKIFIIIIIKRFRNNECCSIKESLCIIHKFKYNIRYHCSGKMKDTAIVIQHVDWGDKRQVTVARTVNGGDSAVGGSRGSTPAVTGSTTRRKEAAVSAATTKSQSKMLLRELCVDKEYLEHLTIDPSNIIISRQYNKYFSRILKRSKSNRKYIFIFSL